jgi:hypothetical protein
MVGVGWYMMEFGKYIKIMSVDVPYKCKIKIIFPYFNLIINSFSKKNLIFNLTDGMMSTFFLFLLGR